MRKADISIFHKFHRPPYGGGNQFLLALSGEFRRRGLIVENNTISKFTRACLFNSFNFDFNRLNALRQRGCRMIHRVDGPITLYRGYEDNSDRRIQKINSQIADVTIFQSHYSLRAHGTLGLEFKAPIIITNAVDPQIFYPPVSRSPLTGRKVRLISTSWSPNPNKGMPTYKWLEAHLNWDRFEYTFVGTSPIRFNRIRMIPPVPSKELADLLRQHDIYITASQHDPCSNALLEALSCGLPAIYRDSGGHPEIVGKAGFAFTSDENIPDLLTQLVDEYEGRQASITIPTLPEVAERYLVAMNMVQSLT